jgi:cytidyltransferase-like protein
MPSAKFFPLPLLEVEIARERKEGKTIVLANGGFDLIHVGHVRYLQQAKAKGDILVVALNSDSSLKELKGAGRALIDEEGRIRIISALACVDYVTLFAERTVGRVLLALIGIARARITAWIPSPSGISSGATAGGWPSSAGPRSAPRPR